MLYVEGRLIPSEGYVSLIKSRMLYFKGYLSLVEGCMSLPRVKYHLLGVDNYSYRLPESSVVYRELDIDY